MSPGLNPIATSVPVTIKMRTEQLFFSLTKNGCLEFENATAFPKSLSQIAHVLLAMAGLVGSVCSEMRWSSPFAFSIRVESSAAPSLEV